jgi:hypothetical protein
MNGYCYNAPAFVLKGLKTALKCQKQEIGKEN